MLVLYGWHQNPGTLDWTVGAASVIMAACAAYIAHTSRPTAQEETDGHLLCEPIYCAYARQAIWPVEQSGYISVLINTPGTWQLHTEGKWHISWCTTLVALRNTQMLFSWSGAEVLRKRKYPDCCIFRVYILCDVLSRWPKLMITRNPFVSKSGA